MDFKKDGYFIDMFFVVFKSSDVIDSQQLCSLSRLLTAGAMLELFFILKNDFFAVT